jgi:DNA-binding response OmpR family regulator
VSYSQSVARTPGGPKGVAPGAARQRGRSPSSAGPVVPANPLERIGGPDTLTEGRHPGGASVQPQRLLLIEDNSHFAAALRNNLEIEGFAVDVAGNATSGLQQIRDLPPALIVLDVMLPGRDGYEVLRHIRDDGLDIPVVLLTARRDEVDKLRGFGLGADDFITKPVSILELIARIRAVLRRAHPGSESAPLWIRFGDVEVHPGTRTVRRSGVDIELRPKEFDLLLALLRHQGRIVSRAELLRDVWGYQADTVSRTVDTHMAGLRQKLELDPLNPRYFITVRSVGYMMRRPPPD